MSNERNKNKYAGFWKRFAAFLIDTVIVFFASSIIGFVFGFLYGSTGGSPDEAEFMGYILGIIVTWLYYAIMESSKRQATFGKQAIGIEVTDLEGSRVSFGKATGRHFGKIISGFIFSIGFLMIAFTEKKQGLHDIMASCLVLNSEFKQEKEDN